MLAVWKTGKAANAQTHLEGVLSKDPDNLTALTQLAVLEFFQYRDLQAVRLAKRALAVNN